MKKVCSECKIEKNLSDYNIYKKYYQTFCKDCYRIRSRRYYKDNKKRMNHMQKIWSENNQISQWASRTIQGHKSEGHIIHFTQGELKNKTENTLFCEFCGKRFPWGKCKKRIAQLLRD